jgi:hypothetical protein
VQAKAFCPFTPCTKNPYTVQPLDEKVPGVRKELVRVFIAICRWQYGSDNSVAVGLHETWYYNIKYVLSLNDPRIHVL